MDSRTAIERLEQAPRLGWAERATPLERHPTLAAAAGLRELWCKRDDQTDPVRGGSKARKLDFILARPPYCDAPSWASVGAIGSSHLLSLVDAAIQLDRTVDAFSFWIPPDPGVSRTLQAIATGPSRIHYRRTRLGLALRWPRALTGPRIGGVPVIAAGGTDPVGTLGMVRAGLELAAQLGSTIPPSRLYIAVGSGGAAAGIAIGLGLAGLPIEVHAVAIVEHIFLSRRRLDGLVAATTDELSRFVTIPAGFAPAPLAIRRGSVGRAYGRPTEASAAAAALLRRFGLAGEGIYTGKAFECLRQDVAAGAVSSAIFWMSGSGVSAPAGASEEGCADWTEALPLRLQSDLQRATRSE